ncbi:DUF6484 domain-containing protein [Mesorhizobium sp. WSM2239]|uniref:DUF6484 domain-containing protein n=2 Tax=unclassified Mesorhizobium TaxID=325217 RepID=A0AAU8DGC8_9HYPH
MIDNLSRIDGVVIGVLIGFGENGPLVVYAGNPSPMAQTARSLSALTLTMVGTEVALLFEEGDPERPLIIGPVVDPHVSNAAPMVSRDGETVRIAADKRIELRCGKAVIIMESDGRIVVRGTHLTSHASATNRIRGGTVNLN